MLSQENCWSEQNIPAKLFVRHEIAPKEFANSKASPEKPRG